MTECRKTSMTGRMTATMKTMKTIDDVVCCVVDSGGFLNMADVMGRACAKSYLWSPECRPFPAVAQACIGDGFDTFERIRDFWPLLDQIDLFCFPDIGLSGLQDHLRGLGKAVWGSGFGDQLELGREFFLHMLDELGLEVPEYTVVEGWDNLERFLRDKEDYYIKISRFRGDMETHHWRSPDMDIDWLASMRVQLGALSESVRFLCFPSIETDIELGADTICVNGQWPHLMLNGFEGKDKTYFSRVTPFEKMPGQIQDIIQRISGYLRSTNYRNQISFEVRVKDDKFYWIDATQRGGKPSS